MGLIRDLAILAAHESGIPPAAMFGRTRRRLVARARFAVMKAARERGRSYGLIAHQLRMGDHTSIIHGCRRAEELEQSHPDFAALLVRLRGEATG